MHTNFFYRITLIPGVLLMSMLLSTAPGVAQHHTDHHHNGREHSEDWPDSLQVITVSGRAIVDSSHFHPLYYLDEDNDENADFQLGFGPYWYQPESGASRPQSDEQIDIKGGLLQEHVPPLIVVFEINGLVWRDSTGAPPWSGGWVHRNASDTTFVFCPTDSSDSMGFPPQSMHGMMFPDSIYCQFEEMPVDSMPGQPDSSMFEGYYSEILGSHGRHMRGGGMMMGFSREISFRFHYDEGELHRRGLPEASIQVQYLDANFNWQTVPHSDLNTDANTVTISDAAVRTFYTLQASATTSVDTEDNNSVPELFALLPNYPNPFNPETTVRYTLQKDLFVQLTIYDIKGRRVKKLFSGKQVRGEHALTWDGTNSIGRPVASGTYLIRLESNDMYIARKMTLLR